MPTAARGFTLIELLIAVAIGALLYAVAIPVYTTYALRAQVGEAIAALGELDMRIERFMADSFRPPNDLAELPGEVPEDPWGQPYRYLRIDGGAPGVLGEVRKDRNLNPINSDYDLYSVGPDGETAPQLVVPTSQDDVVRAGNGGYIGLAGDF